MREPNGSVHEVTPTYGFPAVPLPIAAAHVEPLAVVICTDPSKLLPAPTSPPAECTTSIKPLTVNVSCASSRMFRTVNEHAYGFPIFVGLVHPFVKLIPCWVSSALLAPAMPKVSIPTTNRAPYSALKPTDRRI